MEGVEEILKCIGWPHLVFLFLVIFILIFKHQIAALISQIKTINKSGIKISPMPEAQRENKKEAVQELLTAIGSSPVLQDIESLIKKDLENRGLETKGDSITILIKFLAATKILLEFEQIHGLIFGSQVFLLKRLNEVAAQGAPKEVILSHFKHVQGLYPKEFEPWTVEQYLSFLKGSLLITIQENNYHITTLGVEYLIWMARNGRRENNPL